MRTAKSASSGFGAVEGEHRAEARVGRPGIARTVGLVALGVALAVALDLLAEWIVRSATADQLARSSPRAALVVEPRNALALIAVAESDLAAKPPRIDTATAHLRMAAQADPLNAQIYSDLALVALMRGDSDQANSLFNLAAERSRRVLAPQLWAFDRAARSKDYQTAWRALDVVRRSQPGAVGAMLDQKVAVLAASPDARASLSRLLATNPPWRTSLLLELDGSASSVGTMAQILGQLQDTPYPATDEETRGLLNGMIGGGNYQLAYANWVQLLPAKRLAALGDIYNGRFTADAGAAPFNWIVAADAAGLVALGASEAGTGVRVVPVDRPSAASFVGELLALAPGDYDLRGKVRAPDVTNPQDDGLVWEVRCADTGQVLAQSDPIAVADGWKAFSMAFTVPARPCQGQWLDLHRRQSLTSTQDDAPVLFDDFLIAPRRAALRPAAAL